MKGFILFVAVLCAAASFAFWVANGTAPDGPNWASDVCSQARSFCKNPEQLAYAAAGLAGLWVLMKFMSGIRN